MKAVLTRDLPETEGDLCPHKKNYLKLSSI